MSLKHAILTMLDTQPGSGYDLLKSFKGSLGYFWNAKHQQIYQQLKTLANEGLITYEVTHQEGKPDKKVYAITDAGIADLKEWLSSPVKPNKINDALLVKIYAGERTHTDELIEELDRHIEINKKTLEDLLSIEKSYLKLPEKEQDKFRLPYITLRRGILGERAWLEWAKEAKEMVKK